MFTRFTPPLKIALLPALLLAAAALSGSVLTAQSDIPTPTPAVPDGFRGIQPVVTDAGASNRSAVANDLAALQDLGLLHADDFDGSDPYLAAWHADPGWQLAEGRRGQALELPQRGQRISFVVDSLADIVVSARLQVNGGSAEIRLRESATGFYAVRLTGRGEVQFRRGSELLATVAVPAIARGTWRRIRVSAMDSTIRVALNGTEVIAFQDPDPLPGGKFVIVKRGAATGPLLIDDVKVWLPRIDIPWLRTAAENEAFRAQAMQSRSTVAIPDGDVPGLIEALQLANQPACPNGPTTITLAANGTYTLTDVLTASSLPWGNEGLPRITCDVTIEGQGAVIRRESAVDFRLFSVASGGWLKLNDVTLTGGLATESGGSAIYANFGTVEVYNSAITGNSLRPASAGNNRYGVGIYSILTMLIVDGSAVSANHVEASGSPQYTGGGGISVCYGNAVITNSRIEDNSAGVGGGIDLHCDSPTTNTDLNIADSIIQRNTAAYSYGGGINAGFGRKTHVNITGSTIADNVATLFGGGGLYFNWYFESTPDSYVQIDGSVFNNNKVMSGDGGGAIYALRNLAITNSCIVGNSYPGVENPAFSMSDYTITATSNWWGAPDGPSGAGPGSGDAIEGNVDVSGYLSGAPSGLFCAGMGVRPQNPGASFVPGAMVTYTLTLSNNSLNPVTVDRVLFFYSETGDLAFVNSVPTRTSGAYPPLEWSTGSYPKTLAAGQQATIAIDLRTVHSGNVLTSAQVILSNGEVFALNHTLDVPITQINFDAKLRSVMFWGIFIETNEDEAFSGNPSDDLNTFYGSANPRAYTQFLLNAPYCDALGGNTAPDEILGSGSGWSPNIISISHCNPPDHRSFYAHGIINNFLIRERSTGTNSIMEYLLEKNWTASFGDPEYTVWSNHAICTVESGYSLPYANYREAKDASNRLNGYQPLIEWLHAYLQCQQFSTHPDAVNRKTYLQSAYNNIMRELNLALENLAQDPTDGVTQMKQANQNGNAVPFISVIDNCNTNPTQTTVQMTYQQQHVSTIKTYSAELPTYLRPTLRAELKRVATEGNPASYVLSCYTWVTFSFQRGAANFKR